MAVLYSQPDENAPERAPSAYVLFSNSKLLIQLHVLSPP